MMNKISEKAVLMVLLVSALVYPDTEVNYGVPGAYLVETSPDARAFATGGGSAALVSDVSSVFINPGGLAFMEGMQLTAMHTWLFEDFHQYNVAFGYPFGEYGAIGFDFTGNISPETQGYDSYGISTGEMYRASENTFMLSYSKSFLKRFGVGANFKLSTQSVDEYSDIGVGADIGATAQVYEWLQFGLALINIGGPKIKLISEEDVYSMTMKVGIGSLLLDKRLSVNADMMLQELSNSDNNEDLPVRWSAGAEFWVIPYLALRAGGTGSGTSPRLVNFGAGFRVKSYYADYGLGWHYGEGEKDLRLPFTHSISVKVGFGGTVPEKEQKLENKLTEIKQKQDLYSAQKSYITGDYENALAYITRYTETNPKDTSAKELEKRIKRHTESSLVRDMLEEGRKALSSSNVSEARQIAEEVQEKAPGDSAVQAFSERVQEFEENKKRMKKVKKLYSEKKYDKMEQVLNVIFEIDSTFKAAREFYTKVEDLINERKAEEHFNLASKSYYEDNDVEKAHAELKQVFSLVPDHEKAAKLYEKISGEIKKRYAEKFSEIAEKEGVDVDNENLKNLIKMDAEDKLIRANRLINDKRYNEALEEVNAVLEEFPDNSEADSVKTVITKALNKNRAETLYSEALMAFNSTSLDSAKILAQRALEVFPEHDKSASLLEDINKKLISEDLKSADKLIDSEERGDISKGLELIRDFLSVDPENQKGLDLKREARAKLLVLDAQKAIDKGNYEQANEEIKKALKIDPDNPEVREAHKNIKEVLDVFSE